MPTIGPTIKLNGEHVATQLGNYKISCQGRDHYLNTKTRLTRIEKVLNFFTGKWVKISTGDNEGTFFRVKELKFIIPELNAKDLTKGIKDPHQRAQVINDLMQRQVFIVRSNVPLPPVYSTTRRPPAAAPVIAAPKPTEAERAATEAVREGRAEMVDGLEAFEHPGVEASKQELLAWFNRRLGGLVYSEVDMVGFFERDSIPSVNAEKSAVTASLVHKGRKELLSHIITQTITLQNLADSTEKTLDPTPMIANYLTDLCKLLHLPQPKH